MTCTRGSGYSASLLTTVIAILIFSAALAAGSSSPHFLPVVTYNSGGTFAVSVAIADVNRDGKPDAVMTNIYCYSISNPCVSVLLGRGDGTFKPAVDYPSGGGNPYSVAVADVNGDGKLDIVVANEFNNNVGILLGKGDGTFLSVVTYGSGGSSPTSVAVADVNGDRKADIVVANGPSEELGVLLGNGDGTFQTATSVTYGSGGYAFDWVAVGDVNGDGKPDLIAVDEGTSPIWGVVAVLLGNGNGTFQTAVTYNLGQPGYAVAVADVNGDGKPDLFSAGYVLIGNGDGTFQTPVVVEHPVFPWSVAFADLNDDGKLDLLLAAGNQNSVGVILGNGDGTFQTPVAYASGGYYAGGIAVADVNGDGQLDLLVANRCVSSDCPATGDGLLGVLLNNSRAPTRTALTSSLNPAVIGQAITFTATVSSASGTPPDGEIVTFHKGSAVLGTASLSGGTASLTTSSLPAGVYTVTASYGGDSTFAGDTSPGLRQVVNSTTKSATTTTVVSSLNPSVYGQKVTWTAHVASSGSVPPTGTVTFRWQDFTESFSVGSAMLDSNGVATLTRSNLNADPYPLTAVYNGDTNNLGSTSAVLNQVVTQTTSSATVTSSPNPSAIGQAVTFTANITSPTVTARGPVTFKVETTVLGTAQLSGGRAILTTSSLPVGSTRVTVSYAGNSNIAKSSASVAQVVQP